MTNEEIWAYIGAKYEEFRPHLVAANIPKSEIKVPKRDFEIEAKHFRHAKRWVDTKLTLAVNGVLDVRKLLPDAVWEQYDMHGIEGLREQKMLLEAQKNLKSVWAKTRPNFLKRKGGYARPNKDNDSRTES